MSKVLKPGAIGQDVSDLQSRLARSGYTVHVSAVYDADTIAAVKSLQSAHGLMTDGLYGPKTRAALHGMDTSRLLREVDIAAAAELLDVPTATIKAVTEVESRGQGFLSDGRPVILFERHVFWDRLLAYGINPAPLAKQYPTVVSQQRGGYAGGAAEYVRLATASQICHDAAHESASWGAFQIMGYHYKRLGFDHIDAFVLAQQTSEGEQLATFVAFIQADPNLHRALKQRKWAQFARGYNGPAYAQNLYDAKLARAYARYAGKLETQTA